MRAIHVAVLVALFAAAGALYFLSRGESKSPSSEPAAKAPGAADESPTVQGVGQNTGPAEKTSSQNTEPEREDTERPSDREAFERVGKTGNRVRDYRGTGAPMRDPDAPIQRPFKAKRIDAKLMAKMAGEMRREAERCRGEHSGEIADGASVQPQTTFTIQEGRLTVTHVELSLTQITTDGGFQSCMESAALGLVVDAPNHRDVASESMAIPIKFR